jgi:V/A-type H+-transporting ATPase subunit C
LGIVEVIEDLALNNPVAFTLLVVGLAVLITVVLLMSYFNVLVAIAGFAYPNAMLKAIGNPYIKKQRLIGLMEAGNLGEVQAELTKEGYALSQNLEKADINAIERDLDRAHIESLRKTWASTPQSIRPFMDAFLLKYDAEQIKKVLRARKEGIPNEEFRDGLLPVRAVDQELIQEFLDTNTVEDVCNSVKETKFGDILIREYTESKGDLITLNLTLDKFTFDELNRAKARVDRTVAESVSLFVGRYADIINIKTILRAKQQGFDAQTTERFLVAGGRALGDWKLKQMAETQGVQEALTELEDTPYWESLKGTMHSFNESEGLYPVEAELNKLLFKASFDIASGALITAGPSIKFVVSKEFELQNLKVLIRGMKEGFKLDRIMPLMVTEGED